MTVNLPRRTLAELLAVHKLESKIHDVIVEGNTDKSISEWVLMEHDRHQATVYEISHFEVDAAEILNLGLEDNNRGRVITLAAELRRLGRNLRVTCIADRDFDQILNLRNEHEYLLLTDYSSMLMYLFNERVLGKFIRFQLKGFPKSARRVLQEITATLEILFAVRLMNHLLRAGLRSVAWQDSCELAVNGVQFDLRDYLTRYLNKNARRADQRRIEEQVQECKTWMQFDPRFQVSGHDFIALLIWYISQHPGFKRFGRNAPDGIEAGLFSCLEIRDVEREGLFRQLLARTGA